VNTCINAAVIGLGSPDLGPIGPSAIYAASSTHDPHPLDTICLA
jgi:hypothetical protein